MLVLLTELTHDQANLQNFTSKTQSEVSQILQDSGVNVPNSNLASLLEQAQQQAGLKDFYSVGLWGYCDGSIRDKDVYDTTQCSKPQAEFWFNPIRIWGLNGTGVQNELPSHLRNGLTVYKDVSKWMFIAYVVAFLATVAELVVGVFAICSRWGSCVTSLISGVSSLNH